MKNSIEYPVGLIKTPVSPRMTIENAELRAVLDKAVDDAGLNVTERMALNKKFFPNGGGFELFPKGVEVPQFNFFYKKGQQTTDSFTKEISEIEIPENISRRTDHLFRSSKSCFQANLDNAMKKLKKVLKGNI